MFFRYFLAISIALSFGCQGAAAQSSYMYTWNGSKWVAASSTNPVPTQYCAPVGPIDCTQHVAVSPDAYPFGAIPETADSGDVANTAATATLAAAAGKTTYITGYKCTSTGSTAAATVAGTITGLITGTIGFVYEFVAGATTLDAEARETFINAIPASASNTVIAVSLPAGGTGNLHSRCYATGYQL